MASKARIFGIQGDEDGKLAALLSGRRRPAEEQRVAENHRIPPEIAAPPATPALNSYNIATRVIGGLAEAGTTVTLFDDGVEVDSVVAGADGRWSIALGEIADGNHFYSATASNADGESAASAEIRVLPLSTGGDLAAGMGTVDYSFRGSDFDDFFNILGNTYTDGGASDQMLGGGGNDRYYVSSFGDIVFELSDEGDADQITTALASYTLPGNVEQLFGDISGTALTGQSLTGNDLDNVISELSDNDASDTMRGLEGDDQLFGGDGDDTLEGGGGNDTLEGESEADVAVFSGNRDDYNADTISGFGFELTDRRAGEPEGTDSVFGVETFRFADGDVLAEDLVSDEPEGDLEAVDDSVTTVEDQVMVIDVLANDRNVQVGSSPSDEYDDIVANGDPDNGIVFSDFSFEDGYSLAYRPDPGFVGTDSFTYTVRDENDVESTATVTVTVSEAIDDPDTPRPLAGEAPVNDDTDIFPDETAMVALDGGGYVLVWQTRDGIFGQRYNADDSAAGANFQIDDSMSAFASAPGVTALAGGGFAVVWRGDAPNDEFIGGREARVFGRTYDADGTASGDVFTVNTETVKDIGSVDDVGSPSIATLADGGFVVAWVGGDFLGETSGATVFARRFDAVGNALDDADVAVSETGATNSTFQGDTVAGLADGGYVVAWVFDEDERANTDNVLLARSYGDDGAPVGEAFEINADTIGSPRDPDIASLDDGGFILVWNDRDDAFGPSSSVYAQRFDDGMAPVGSQLTVNTQTYFGANNPVIATNTDGGFVVAWETSRLDGGTGDGVYAQAFDADSNFVGDEFRVNQTRANNQRGPDVALLENGDPVFTWSGFGRGDDFGVQVRRFSFADQANQAPVAPDDTITFLEDQPVPLNFLANDSDADGDPLTVTLIFDTPEFGLSGAGLGQLPNGAAFFTPATDFTGEISFGYEISDGRGGTDTGRVTVVVAEANDPEPIGDEAVANSAVDGDQSSGSVTALESGGFLLTWADAARGGVFGRRFDGDGDPVDGEEFEISTQEDATGFSPPFVAELDNGGFVATYTSAGADGDRDVRARLLDADGQPSGAELVVAAPGNQAGASAAALGGGDVIITWSSRDADGNSEGFFGRIYGGDGSSVDFTVDDESDASGFGGGTAVSALPGGGFIVAYTVSVPGDDPESDGDDGSMVVARRFGADGQPIDAEPFVLGTSDRSGEIGAGGGPPVEIGPSITALGEGFVVTWADTRFGFNGFEGGQIDGRMLDAMGAPVGDELQINSNQSGNLSQSSYAVTPLDDGGFVATWESSQGAAFLGNLRSNIVAQIFDADGARVATEFLVNAPEVADRGGAAVAELADGSLVFSWSASEQQFGERDIFLRRFTPQEQDDNTPPVAADDAATTDEDQSVTISVLANDSDADGDTLTVTAATAPSNGTVAVNADGTITYTPDPNSSGTDSFTYTVSDGDGGSDTGLVRITVTEVNDPPVANDDAATTNEGEAVVIDVTANDTDPDVDVFTVTAVTAPANGTVVFNEVSVTYTPDAGFTGADSFEYTITDNAGVADTATVTVTVEGDGPPANSDPVAADDGASTDKELAVVISVLANDSDADGDALTVTATTAPANGSVTINPDGTLTYTPDAGFFGVDSFDYTISDGNGGSGSASVTVTVDDDICGVTLSGGASDDLISGSRCGDLLTGAVGNDLLVALPGRDTLDGGDGDDRLEGNGGMDTLLGVGGADTLAGGGSADRLDGDVGDDRLIGSQGRDTMLGGDGDDRLDGGLDKDELLGGAGDDTMVGNEGRDTMTGGTGADRFRFDDLEGFSGEDQFADRIMDFSQADGDAIDLRNLDAIVGGEDDAFAFIGGAAFSGVAGELRFESGGTDITYVQGDIDGNGTADFTIRLESAVALVAADFIL